MTLEELKAEAKRQGYKPIKDENIKFEPCLCGGTRREWWSGPEGHGGMPALWTGKPLGAQMRRKKRCEESLERHDFGEKEGARKWLTEAM